MICIRHLETFIVACGYAVVCGLRSSRENIMGNAWFGQPRNKKGGVAPVLCVCILRINDREMTEVNSCSCCQQRLVVYLDDQPRRSI